MIHLLRILIVALSVFFFASITLAQNCADCHKKITPNIVSDWQLSKHFENKIDCSGCHGDQHKSAQDVSKVKIPTPDTCTTCHEAKVKQFKAGKHAIAWAAMKAMPSFHSQPVALTEGMKGCGGCHKIGLKTDADVNELKKDSPGFGLASCDACHTRHTFSIKEARQPQACQTCHAGFDHPQWEMYSGSKHGVRFMLKQAKVLPENTSAPTCQTCHMQGGNHEVRTAWGFLAIRGQALRTPEGFLAFPLQMPEGEEWIADRRTILQALGVLDPEGDATPRRNLFMTADVARMTQEAWQKEREKMVKTCNECHSVNFAKAELGKGDKMIREADRLMAEAIRVVAALYENGILTKPKNYTYAFPDLLNFHDAPTVIEQKLFVMFLEHRMRAFQGTFHANPDYALWYGWSELKMDLTEIKTMAAEMRERAKADKK
jgi:hydroxylamine dehydrogenase